MKRPHADLIHAWAEGAEIEEFDTFNDEWEDKTYPTFNKYCQYRIKPKKTVILYKRYLGKVPSVGLYIETFTKGQGDSPEKYEVFVRWIDTEWQEYEVEGE